MIKNAENKVKHLGKEFSATDKTGAVKENYGASTSDIAKGYSSGGAIPKDMGKKPAC